MQQAFLTVKKLKNKKWYRTVYFYSQFCEKIPIFIHSNERVQKHSILLKYVYNIRKYVISIQNGVIIFIKSNTNFDRL